MNKYFLSSSIVNDKQRVLSLFNQAEYHLPAQINRRSFCRLTGLSLISLLLPGCSTPNTNTSLQVISQEVEFSQFFDVIFPASSLGLIKYNAAALKRIQRLPIEHAQDVILLYRRFKASLWLKRDLGTKQYTRSMGEACLIELLHSKYKEQYNHALDIVYYELSKDNKLISALWGRPFSLNDKKCLYWDNYDQAIS